MISASPSERNAAVNKTRMARVTVIPSHSRRQRFLFDRQTGLLRQHNYCADVISRFARAANVVHDHDQSDGLIYPAHRRVTPAGLNGKPLPFPELIDIQVHRYVVQQ